MALSGATGPAGVLCAGDLNLDVVVTVPEGLAPGSDIGGKVELHGGGSAANAATWAARGGVPSRMVCAVGDDQVADVLVRGLAADGVDVIGVARRGARSRTVAAIVGPSGDRSLVTDIHDDVTLRAGDYTPRWFDGVGWLHLTGYLFILAASRPLFHLLTREAAAREIPYSIDPSAAELLRSCARREEVLAAFGGAELLLPSHDEAAYLTGTADPATAAEQLLEVAVAVAVTCGPDGAYVAQRGRPTFHVPAEPVAAPNALGCGDAFAGGVIAELVSGRSIEDAAHQGVALAARAARLPSAR